MEHRYFTPDSNDATLKEIFNVCIESASTCRDSLDDSLIVVKLPYSWSVEPLASQLSDCLIGVPEFTEANILIEMAKPAWYDETLGM